MNENRPIIGITGSEGYKLDTLNEMLNNLGILFEDVREGATYPCIIIPEKDDAKFKLAQNHAADQKDILIAGDIIQFDVIFKHLSGVADEIYLENKLLEVPLNSSAQHLLQTIKNHLFSKNLPLVRKSYWPNFAPACAAFTHDIDTMNNPPPSTKKSRWFRYLFHRIILKKAYSDNIDNIIKIERLAGIKSSYFFFSNYGKHQDHFHQITKGKISNDIGLHGSSHSFQDPKLLAEEKKALEKLFNREVRSIRQHGLNFNIPQTWRYQLEAGFDHDLSFYYNDKFGFRPGICHPYHPFNSLTNEKFDILELPTSFMDWTADQNGMNSQQIDEQIRKLSTIVEKYHGILVLNFHNMFINEKTHPDITRSFENAISYVRKKEYWIATVSECAKWWRIRETTNVRIEQEGKTLNLQSDNEIPLIIEYPDGKIERKIVNAKGIKTEWPDD